jgi:hypothetical protein
VASFTVTYVADRRFIRSGGGEIRTGEDKVSPNSSLNIKDGGGEGDREAVGVVL